MLTPRQAQLAFIPIAAGVMSGVISLALTAINVGLGPDLLGAWLQHWPLAFAVALPAAWLVLPAVRALLARWTDPAPAPGTRRQVGDLG
jgi:hypothetical protein